MPYVICEKCGGYYELKEGESAEDFDKCQCGGELKYTDSVDLAEPKQSGNEMKFTKPETEKKEHMKQPENISESKGETLEKRFCRECGAENRPDSTFCHRCGTSFSPGASSAHDVPVHAPAEQKKTSRTIELVLGILGGIFGLLGGIFGVLFSIFASSVLLNGLSAIIASIVGIVAAAYVLRDAKWGGIILLVSAIWLLISISLFGILGAALLGVAGLLALLRK